MNLKKGKLVRGLFAALSVLLAFCMLATGCGGNGMQNGLDSSSTLGCAYNSYMCAYKSDKTEFNINDVTLELSYGCYFINDVEWVMEHGGDIFSYFDIYIESCQKNGDKTLIKRVEENLISEKYRITRAYDENNYFVGWKFNYSEMITIPKEVFSKDKDRLVFRIYGESLRDDGLPSYRMLTFEGIGYKVIDDKVILAEEFGEDWEKYENYYNLPKG